MRGRWKRRQRLSPAIFWLSQSGDRALRSCGLWCSGRSVARAGPWGQYRSDGKQASRRCGHRPTPSVGFAGNGREQRWVVGHISDTSERRMLSRRDQASPDRWAQKRDACRRFRGLWGLGETQRDRPDLHGKEGVIGSSPIVGSRETRRKWGFLHVSGRRSSAPWQ